MIHIVEPGLLTTVQDLGRSGFRRFGVGNAGAVDSFSHTVANVLVGNPAHCATLEMTLRGGTFRADETMLIALAGADAVITVDGRPVPMWRPVLLPRHSTLMVGSVQNGCRVYLAVAGGLAVPEQLGAKSTDLRGGFGGHRGRRLQAGDALARGTTDLAPWSEAIVTSMSGATHGVVRWPRWGVSARWVRLVLSGAVDAMPGQHYDWLTDTARQKLWQTDFFVTAQADRMGVRLEGPALSFAQSRELLSAGVMPGTVQLPVGGHPLVLLADGQTTGGYPRVLHIATADLPKAAQWRPGARIRFQPVTLDQAQAKWQQQQQQLRALAQVLREYGKEGW